MYIEEFEKYLKNIKIYSEKTITSYMYDLKDYSNFLEKNHLKITDDTKETMSKYLNHLNEKKISKRSISRHLSTMRTYYEYLKKEKIINNNIFQGIKNPKIDKKIPTFINHEDLNHIIHSFTQSDIGKRDHLIVELLYATGLRVGELVNIKLKNIDFGAQSIKVVGKGNKERYVFYNTTTSELLKDYLKIRAKTQKTSNEYLLLNDKGNKITEAKVRQIIKNTLIKTGIKNKITPHTFRHTFATDLLNAGADLVNVKELLGHASLNTTSIYTHITNDRIKEVYNKAHPRAKW